MKRVRKVLLALTGRYLNEAEAHKIRNQVIKMNPKVYAVMPNWPWIEVRYVTDTNAEQLLEALRGLPGVQVRTLECA
jgi:hypothetical protein